MPSRESEPTIPANKWPYSYALDRAATGTDANSANTELQKGENFKLLTKEFFWWIPIIKSLAAADYLHICVGIITKHSTTL
jgi:hypothetical protein